jgi:hypothetical protein
MKHDPFDFSSHDMTPWDRTWRVLFLLAIVAIALMNLYVWQPL